MEMVNKVLLSCLLVAFFVLVEEFFVLNNYVSSIQLLSKIDKTDTKQSARQIVSDSTTHAHNTPVINKRNAKFITKIASRNLAAKRHKWSIDNKVKTVKGKLVLLYTPLFEELPWKGLLNTFQFTHFRDQPCSVTNCTLSYDKRLFYHSDVVIFHARDIRSTYKINLLHRRRPKGQIWVYFDLENPDNSQLNLSEFHGMFNWTMTYENNADIHLPYGSYTKVIPGEQPQLEKIDLANKDRLVVWTVSNCGGLREKYVQRLTHHIRVDIFGSCADYYYQPKLEEEECPKATKECDSLLKRYKFYLSFENGNCVDYITEKYWGSPLELGIVPVVLGGADYKNIAIPGSYINALDFPSVTALGDYLLYLDKNDTAYMKYFEWRKMYKVDGHLKTDSFNKHYPWTCDLCEKAQNPEHKVYESLGNFRHPTTHCGIHEEKILDMIDSESEDFNSYE